ncbi:alanine racemase [Halocynthiibacter sp. C4]|uniref:alanine racemase n=1 Tax=Halocynthiibacter sp. C4 TaxID=2992758 RepID=UPI00237BEA52|nr:alanine racemase [Halocynthiibacter sp. C4]MDE0591508.1 alanine racemase [Halocynthiibacter sp. C4]
MFLDLLMRRNPQFIEAAMALHQQGKLPSNAYVLDLDTVEENARVFQAEARKHGLTTFAMTKQVGRHSGFCEAVMKGGIDRSVAVDMACATACDRAGLKTGHLGHLVQVPSGEAEFAAAKLQPDFWTVFSDAKAKEAADASAKAGRVQKLLARIQTEGDTFYRGHEGGFDAQDIVAVADRLDTLEGGEFAGITTFPALLFDQESRKVIPTHNLSTLNRAAEALAAIGRKDIAINAPGTNSAVMLAALAEAGATQCEPGNALHGTTPLHAVEDLPEAPAVLYLSEVSHHYGDKAYCFGGGLYIDPVFPKYQVKALVGSTPTSNAKDLRNVEIPDYSAIDYYAMIDTEGDAAPKPRDTVVFGFRGQAFVTRALVVGVRGISTGNPTVTTIENGFGDPVAWPGSYQS